MSAFGADPGNVGWQRDLAFGYGRVAGVRARQGANSEAALLFEQGRTIIARLRQASPDKQPCRGTSLGSRLSSRP